MKLRWAVTEADLSGNNEVIYSTDSPYAALVELNRLRAKRSNRAYGVLDAENPERGDAQELVEGLVFGFGVGVPDAGRRYDSKESERMLLAAKHAALSEIVKRGMLAGRGEPHDSIYDAVEVYCTVRNAQQRAFKEWLDVSR